MPLLTAGVADYAEDPARAVGGETSDGAEIVVRVRDDGLGGRVWAEFPGGGAVFAFALPARRGTDTCLTPGAEQ